MRMVEQLALPWHDLAPLPLAEMVETLRPILSQHPDIRTILHHSALLPEEAVVYFYANRYWFYSRGWGSVVELILNAILKDRADLFYLTLFPKDPTVEASSDCHGVALASIFKSGTIFLNSKLAAATRKPFVKNGIFEAPFVGKPLPNWCDLIKQYGGAWGSHSWATAETFQTAKHMGYDKIFVHLRNPFQATLSAYHYVDKFLNSSHPDDHQWRDACIKGVIDPDYPTLSEPARKRRLAQTIGLQQVAYINGWLAAPKTPEGLSLGFGSHEEMVQDQDAYFIKIADFYGFDAGQRQRFLQAEGARGHFRKGLTDEYLTAFPDDVIELLASNLDPAAYDRFPWDNPAKP